MADKPEAPTPRPQPAGLNIRLTPVEHSDQPKLANITRVSGAPGMVFVDFGFLEPGTMAALSRVAAGGGKLPEALNGKLAVRVALGYDTLVQLHHQLGQALASLKPKTPPAAAPSPAVKPKTRH
ncbi:MAG: hypothetical protein ACREUW_16610 [Burkholderiales bacterium]